MGEGRRWVWRERGGGGCGGRGGVGCGGRWGGGGCGGRGEEVGVRGGGHVDGGDMLMATWKMGVVTFPSPCRLSIAISFVPRESGREGG